MSVLLFLIPVSLALAGTFVAICVASIRDGQFDDLESPGWRVLFDGAPEVAAPTASAATQAQIGFNSEEAG